MVVGLVSVGAVPVAALLVSDAHAVGAGGADTCCTTLQKPPLCNKPRQVSVPQRKSHVVVEVPESFQFRDQHGRVGDREEVGVFPFEVAQRVSIQA